MSFAIARLATGERGEKEGPSRGSARSAATSCAARHLSSDAAGRARLDRCWNDAQCSRSWDLLKSTMLQLDPAFSEKAYGCGSFSEFVDKLKRADFVNVTGTGGRTLIERKGTSAPEMSAPKPEEAIPSAARHFSRFTASRWRRAFRPDTLFGWMKEENPELRSAEVRIPGVHGIPQFRSGQAGRAP